MRLLNRCVSALVVTGTITVLGVPAGPAAFGAPAPPCQIWVTSRISNQPTIVDGVTSQISTLDIGDKSWDVAMTPDGSKVYIATDSSGIKVIDVSSNYQLSTINRGSFVVAASPDGTKMYTTDWTPGVVYEYGTSTDAPTGRSAATSTNPIDMVVSPDGAYIYVANYNTSPETVTKIETANFIATQHVVGPGVSNAGLLAGLAISPNGAILYATQYTSGQVIAINTSDMQVLWTLAVHGQPGGVVVNSTGSTIYVVSTVNDHVVAIDTTTRQVTATITVGSAPQNLVIAPDDSQLFVANRGSNTVSRIDLTSNAVIETIAVNSQPFDLAIGPALCSTVAPQQAPTPVPVPVWRVSMDPAGGECVDGGLAHNDEWTSVFIGYRYLPGESDCQRNGFEFSGWADADDPDTPLTLPLLVDPSDGSKRWFVAANYSLVAVWAKVEQAPELPEDLSGTAPGAFVGGPDRATAEGGGVVDGYYIPPRVEFGSWMFTIPR